MWLPEVITSTPAANRSLAVDSVRPIPPARFSPLAVTKSIPRDPRRSPRSASTASRPGLPITSPIIRTRQAPDGRGALPLAGLPRRTWRELGATGAGSTIDEAYWTPGGLASGHQQVDRVALDVDLPGRRVVAAVDGVLDLPPTRAGLTRW